MAKKTMKEKLKGMFMAKNQESNETVEGANTSQPAVTADITNILDNDSPTEDETLTEAPTGSSDLPSAEEVNVALDAVVDVEEPEDAEEKAHVKKQREYDELNYQK